MPGNHTRLAAEKGKSGADGPKRKGTKPGPAPPMAKQARVSLADVAAAAHVSVMTVSNVVRGREDLVKQETRERVQAAIGALNYRPQTYGRALRTSRTSTIGLLIAVQEEDFLSSPWTSRMVAGLSNYLNRNDYGLLVHGQTPLKLEEALLLRLSNTDGLCVMLSGTSEVRQDLLRRVTQLGLPVVALQEHLDPTQFDDLAIVRQDDYGGGALVGRHLVRQGARRLAFLELAFSFPAMSQRMDGIRSELGKKKGAYVHKMECRGDTIKDVMAVTEKYLSEHELPDAFIAANERLALGLLASLKDRGIAAPDDVLLASFNAFDLWAYAINQVPTIDFPAYEVGARAGKRMIERLESGTFRTRTDILPAKLVRRDEPRDRTLSRK